MFQFYLLKMFWECVICCVTIKEKSKKRHLLSKKHINLSSEKPIQIQELQKQPKAIEDNEKEKIIKQFREYVKNTPITNTKKNDGSEGHWLETQMGLQLNSKNEPDIYGYEMKKISKKITFGDFSASEYLFSKQKPELDLFNQTNETLCRNDFIRIFGAPNPHKNNRYSWSGKCVPKYGIWNEYGQILFFNECSDLCIEYSYEKDTRQYKNKFPEFLKHKNILIAIWKMDKLKKHIDQKFNIKGFFICKKKSEQMFSQICFGKPFNFDYFMEHIKNKNIIFDSGMYMGNTRNYSHFRSTFTNFWENLIIETYE